MKRTVDKFGHYHGHAGGMRGPRGEGFSLDQDGNYDMMSKRLKRVGTSNDPTDAATVHQVNALATLCKEGMGKIGELAENLPDELKIILENFKGKELQALIQTSIEASPKIAAQEEKIKKFKQEQADELKMVAGIIRGFIVKTVQGGKGKLSQDQEKKVFNKLKEPGSTWRDAFPEISKES